MSYYQIVVERGPFPYNRSVKWDPLLARVNHRALSEEHAYSFVCGDVGYFLCIIFAILKG
jgi:hypothetical protein